MYAAFMFEAMHYGLYVRTALHSDSRSPFSARKGRHRIFEPVIMDCPCIHVNEDTSQRCLYSVCS